MRKTLLQTAVGAILMASIGSAATVYNTDVGAGQFTGSRSIGNGLAGTGAWGTNPPPNIMISWAITSNGDGTLHYRYEFSGDTGTIQGEPSHLLLELSSNCTSTSGCVTNPEGDGVSTTLTYGTFSPSDPGNSNPGLPGSISGVKFNISSWVYEFDSNRTPVWGDIYSKDGNAGGLGENAVWNTGILLHATSENILDFVARPDTELFSDEVPEPGTLALFGLGAIAIGIFRKKR